MWDRPYVEISLVGGTDKAASRAAHVNSPAPFLYGCGGGANDHEGDVASSGLGADALRAQDMLPLQKACRNRR